MIIRDVLQINRYSAFVSVRLVRVVLGGGCVPHIIYIRRRIFNNRRAAATARENKENIIKKIYI